jgi:hypothetical protein
MAIGCSRGMSAPSFTSYDGNGYRTMCDERQCMGSAALVSCLTLFNIVFLTTLE